MLAISKNKNGSSVNININDRSFNVPLHWFWDQFGKEWEPKTADFFSINLQPGSGFLDIGAWVGPTAMIATSLGAGYVKITEPNPVNFFHLLSTQINNNLLSDWQLVNACVSADRTSKIIGPIEGIASSSSATNIRDPHQSGAKIISLKLEDLIETKDDFSLIKIDIEGAEAFVISDFYNFANLKAAIWLSIHPPFISNKHEFLKELLELDPFFYFVDESNKEILKEDLEVWILTNEEKPEWGTSWGNFFEIGLLPKVAFDKTGSRI